MGILSISDTIYTFRFLKILSTKWTNLPAYKLGIIDENGIALKKSKDLITIEEKKAYTPFVRLIFKLKRMMGTIPGGKSAIARYGAAIALIKEHSEEVKKMGINLKIFEDNLKKYIDNEISKERLDEGFVNKIDNKISGNNQKFKYNAKKKADLEMIIQSAIGKNMNVEETEDGVSVEGEAKDHNSLIKTLQSLNISGMVTEEVTNSVGGIEGKDQSLGKKGKIQKRKKKKDEDEDEVIDKNNTKDTKDEETSFKYQVIDGDLIRIDEIKRKVKKRIIKGKRSKKREYVPTKRRTRTGRKKLRGAAKTRWKKSHKKAYRKSKTGSAKHKRKRSMKKSRKYNK